MHSLAQPVYADLVSIWLVPLLISTATIQVTLVYGW